VSKPRIQTVAVHFICSFIHPSRLTVGLLNQQTETHVGLRRPSVNLIYLEKISVGIDLRCFFHWAMRATILGLYNKPFDNLSYINQIQEFCFMLYVASFTL